MIGIQPGKGVASQGLTVHHGQDIPDEVPPTTQPDAQIGLAWKQGPGCCAPLHEEAPAVVLWHLAPERNPEQPDGSHDHGRGAFAPSRPLRRGFHVEQPQLGSVHCIAVDLQPTLPESPIHGHAQPGAPDEKPVLVERLTIGRVKLILGRLAHLIVGLHVAVKRHAGHACLHRQRRVARARILARSRLVERLLQAQDFGLALVAIRGHALVRLIPRGLDRSRLFLADGFLARLGRSLAVGKALLEFRLDLLDLGHRIGRGLFRLLRASLREHRTCPTCQRQAKQEHRDA